MPNKITKLISYLFGKKSELKDLETKDVLLAKIVLDIHRKRTHSTIMQVPLFKVKQIHAIDRENAIDATEKRIQIITNVKEKLLQQKIITKDLLNKILPSVSGIKVVKETDQSYIAYEGNGRLVALQKVFEPGDDISIEVEEYRFKNPKKILRRIQKVRKLNKLI
jgi:hypothetical protein